MIATLSPAKTLDYATPIPPVQPSKARFAEDATNLAAAAAKLGKKRLAGLMHLSDKLLLRKRAIIESIIDQLKNISQIEHSRHRSPVNFVVHLVGGLLAYSHQEKKPGLHLDERALLAA